MPCGMTTPVAQRGKSWSNAWRNACRRSTRGPCDRVVRDALWPWYPWKIRGFPRRGTLPSSMRWRCAETRASRIGRPGPPATSFAILCNASPSSASQSRTTCGLTGVPILATCSAIWVGEELGPHDPAPRRGRQRCGPPTRTSDSVRAPARPRSFFRPPPRAPHAPHRRIVGKLVVEFDRTAFDRASRTSQHIRHNNNATPSKLQCFQRRISTAVFFGQCLIEPAHPLCHLWLVPNYRLNRHPWTPGHASVHSSANRLAQTLPKPASFYDTC